MFVGTNTRGIVVIFDYEYQHEIEFCKKMLEGLRDTAETEEIKQKFADALEQLAHGPERGRLQ